MALDPITTDTSPAPPVECPESARPSGPARGEETATAAELRSLLAAMNALCDGDFTVRADTSAEGVVGEMAGVFNQLVVRNAHLSGELHRVRREVVRQGRLDERITASPGQGAWATTVDAANQLVDALAGPVSNATRVLDAIASGDLTQRVDLHDGNRQLRGDLRRLGRGVNRTVDQLALFTGELTRIAREVGTEGRLGGRAKVQGLSGDWRMVTEAVNTMASRLTAQVRDIAEVTTAVARGDLTRQVTVEATGELLELKLTVNTMVDQLGAFADEVTRVAREVGTEGELGGRAQVRGVSGVWKDLTDSVNFMASNLTSQVRNIAQVTTAVATGDLSQKITVDAKGEILQLKLTVNTMVDQLSAFADEVTRVAREVGTEGRLGGRAQVRGVSGVWKDLTQNVNFMADNLTSQVRNIAQVATAVADGDLSKTITVEAKGEILQLKLTVNTMVDQLSAFADEVTRVAREVGTEGRLGGRAQVRGVSGVWKDLTQNVNFMADNLTSQVRNIAQVATAVAEGDLSKTITVEAKGEILELKSTINTMVDRLSSFADEVTRVAREVGTEGNLGGQAQVRGVSGVWRDLTENVNFMALNLTSQVRNIAQVTTAVANGDLSKKITVDARGEILELKDTVNTMVQQLRSFADEVTRVAREVGTEGQLGGRAGVPGVSGVWKDLTDNVNFMASNLTSQVRNIAQVATAVADGDLSKKIDVDARGEILELKTTINTMVDTLSSFSDEVTRVAREVGSEGRLGGQARVEGVYGTWKRLTTGVNELALNLTTQVRAIAEVASAVAQGDMSGSISVEAQGEVAELKNNVNLMVANLRETTRAKDWLESNLARIASLMQGHRDLVEVADLILSELTPLVNAQFGAFFLSAAGARPGEGLELIAGYGTDQGAVGGDGQTPRAGVRGRGLVAQAAVEKKRILINDVPPDYITIDSGLGSALPASVVILPILYEDQVLGVIELASFSRFSDVHLAFIDQFVNTIGVSINTIIANARTESLLSESQRLTTELRQRSNELQRSNAELEEKAALLATASQYKSEFLANMSHELRTPLNSLLILARLLADNPEDRLSAQEVQFAATIHRSGSDLLQLINDILDLSKIEAGRMDVRPKKLPLVKILDYVNATFRPLAVDRGLSFEIAVGEDVPREMFSDEQRLQQILRNLLSNALKFTSSGGVTLRVERAPAAQFEEETLRAAGAVIAFSVTDTGIGIPPEKLPVIFEAFQQSDGTTSRKYGGTGLGLSISREIAGMLGGRIVAESELGVGSRFTLYVPAHYSGVAPAPDPSDPRATGSTVPAVAPASDETLPDTADHAPSGVFGEADSLDAGRLATRAPGGGAEAEAGSSGESEGEDHDDGWPGTTRLKEWQRGRPGQVLNGRRILIVDDDIRNVFALTHVLGRVGMTVKYAENGREGLEVLHRNPDVSLVLMDVMMPEMDGYETIRAIRCTPRLADVPILALTAKAMPGDREKAIDSGANGYVPKPVDVDRLMSAILDLLDPDSEVGEPGRPGESGESGEAGESGSGDATSDGETAAPAETGPPRPRQGER
ncbi:HAMP domain-containing protein [Streptomyces sp. 5-10]|uniref:HAMP domain-containing protein n=1 Tax=Streptomyces sp. 5-10 TaxID=878925 RepID=UPI00168AAA87|nr:HAMP domain-containing protein [Streptomyces sp. 5-10]MBD3005909.1 HAMP domain-containing protein [Streptomyces sp. 5-10]